MIGLGPGARSYTQALHYSTEYAVGQPGVLSIINQFNARTTTEHGVADYGARLDSDEQKLRYVIKSLLRSDGISHEAYRDRFDSSIYDDVPALNDLGELGLAEVCNGTFRLTEEGISWSDTIGPWLYSEAVTNRMDAYELA